MLLALGLAAAAGILMALQGGLNGALSKIIGLLETTFVVHWIGTATVTVLLFAGRLGNGDLLRIPKAPWYILLGGLLGVPIVYGVAASITRAGAAPATASIIVGQVLTAAIIDNFGLFGLERIPFAWWKIFGVVFLAAGACILLHKG